MSAVRLDKGNWLPFSAVFVPPDISRTLLDPSKRFVWTARAGSRRRSPDVFARYDLDPYYLHEKLITRSKEITPLTTSRHMLRASEVVYFSKKGQVSSQQGYTLAG